MDSQIALAMASLTTGIYVLTVAEGDCRHGMSSSWVTQVSGEPPLIMAAVDVKHFSHDIIIRTGKLGLNVVGKGGKALEDYFYSAQSRRPDNLAPVEFELSPVLGVPWLNIAMVSIEAQLRHQYAAGDHSLFVAEALSARLRNHDEPLSSLDLPYIYVGGGKLIERQLRSRDRRKPI